MAKSTSSYISAWPIKRRRLPSDTFFEEGNILCNIHLKQIDIGEDDYEEISECVPDFQCHIAQCSKWFNTVRGYSAHYNAIHKNVCSECKRSFPTHHLLDLHILETHDNMFSLLAQQKPMYECLVQTCGIKYKTSKDRREHLIKDHKYPASFRFDRPQRNKKTPNPTPSKVSMETDSGPTSSADNGTMETDHVPSNTRKHVYRVPKNISFGRGVSRGFHGSRRGRHWHQRTDNTMDTTVSIDNVDMNDLASALEGER